MSIKDKTHSLVGAVAHPVGMAVKAGKRAAHYIDNAEKSANALGKYEGARSKYKQSKNTKTQSTKTYAAKKRAG